MRFVVVILSILSICACSSMKKISKRTADDRGYIARVGDKAPDFTMEFLDGSKHKLSDYKGKVVMLQFTASWCGVCIKEMPHIENEIWAIWKEEDLIVIGVDRDEPKEKAQLLKDKTKVTYPIALDPGADIFGRFADKKSGVTRNVIIDKKGKIVFLTRLFNPKEFEEMKQKIAAIL